MFIYIIKNKLKNNLLKFFYENNGYQNWQIKKLKDDKIKKINFIISNKKIRIK